MLRAPNPRRRPLLYDRAPVEPAGWLGGIQQVDTAAFMHTELLSHELLDHGPVHRASNLPPMQNFESLGPNSQVNTDADVAYMAKGGEGLYS